MVGEPVTGLGVSRLHFPVTTLGPGRRAAIWLQGCSIHCPGCVSRDTWAPAASLTEVAAVADWIEDQADDGLTGITVSGGEPLDQPEQLAALLTDLRRRPRTALGRDCRPANAAGRCACSRARGSRSTRQGSESGR